MTSIVPHEVVLTNAPFIRIHPKEKYNITDYDEFVKLSYRDNVKFPVLKKGISRDYAPLLLKTNVKYNIVSDDTNHYIIYHLFHAYNGPKRVLGLVGVDDHEGDLENFIVKLDNKFKVIKYWLSQHGDYLICDPSQIKRSINNTPVIYSAVNSHALYITPDTKIRMYGFGNDTTSDQGRFTQTVPQIVKEDDISMRVGGRLAVKINQLRNPGTYGRAIGERFKISNWLIELLSTCALFIIPIITGIALHFIFKLSIERTVTAILVVTVIQMYIVKIVMTILLGMFDLKVVSETWKEWISFWNLFRY